MKNGCCICPNPEAKKEPGMDQHSADLPGSLFFQEIILWTDRKFPLYRKKQAFCSAFVTIFYILYQIP
ncbi:MAG: hypothetical protein KH128_11320 [Firmicutes bacterium]|nr:hypothetical protein [Bacillota bacterium]